MMISVRDWNSYLNKLYEFPNAMENIQTLITQQEVFNLEDLEFGDKQLVEGKLRKS